MLKDTYQGPSPDILKSLPPEAYAAIPFALPPSGIEANFDNPPTRVPVIFGVSFTYLAITTFFLGIRAYTKVAIAKKWRWDDTLVVLGYMFSIAYFFGVTIGCIHGAAGRHGWDVHLDKAISHGSLIQSYVTTIMSTPALGLIKMSLFIQYYYLFGVMRYVRVTVYIGATLTAAYYVSISITAFVLNGPWPGESLLDVILSWHYLKFAKFSIPGGVIGMLVDWTLLILPIPAVWGLAISRKRRLGVMLIFMTGTLGAIASVVSLYYRVQLQNDPTDTTWKVGYVLLWSQIEMWSGVTAACMPSVKQFFNHLWPASSHDPSLRPFFSNLRIRSIRSTRQKLPHSEATFAKWGYRSDVQQSESKVESLLESSSVRLQSPSKSPKTPPS